MNGPAPRRLDPATPPPDPQDRWFQGKSVLVTGGSRGVGRAIAERFAELGAARVAISYLRNDRAAEEAAEAVRALGAEPVLLRGNLGDPEKAAAIAEQAGPLDVLVSNAASGVIRPALELDEKHWDWTMNANARALLTLTRHAAPSMPAGSSIVAISSLGSTRVLDNYVLVGTSKAALESLVRYLAVELAPRDIRVNAVSAGLIETGALEHFPNREEMLSHYGGLTPAGRLVEPVDVADAVAFLASPEARMIRGHTLVVDGGYSLLA
jgi:enoyl-[acyl-carrier protein] reductase III